ncbi:MAG: GTPase HflX [Proteobacteria bacterium]|nr:GTPase HflX [Pseudomonadota bacterium]
MRARDPELRLEEAVGLAQAIELDVVHAEVVRTKKVRPSTFLGKGAVDQFTDFIEAQEIGVVIVDTALAPIQQRNLERAWNTKVIDRAGLILEIFGARARTHEGRLQVELAALNYQRSRLVRSWTHLERQRGGLGFIGGPGESQLEIGRRLIGERIARLRRELDEVKRTRALHRDARKRVPYPVVALVGYTNAGKSTLFNRLTNAKVMARDMLFATLDPTMRSLALPSGRNIVLSDTVGFISELPTQLVAAFQATLEEVAEADLIVHVRDIASPDSEAQKRDVEDVLAELGLEEARPVEALNKLDLLGAEAREVIANRIAREPDGIALSALTGAGCERLLEAIDRRLSENRHVVNLDIDLADGAALAWLYRHGEILERQDEGLEAHLVVALDAVDEARFRSQFQNSRA